MRCASDARRARSITNAGQSEDQQQLAQLGRLEGEEGELDPAPRAARAPPMSSTRTMLEIITE